MDKVINHDNILKVSIGYDAQVFDKEAILGLHAIPSMQQSMDILAFLVKVGHYWLSICLRSRCEHINRIVFTHLCQELHASWTYVEPKFFSFMTKTNISLVSRKNRMDQRLI